MGSTGETDWAWAVPVVLLFSRETGLDWDFAVGSEDVSLGSFSGILSFYMKTVFYLFVKLLYCWSGYMFMISSLLGL